MKKFLFIAGFLIVLFLFLRYSKKGIVVSPLPKEEVETPPTQELPQTQEFQLPVLQNLVINLDDINLEDSYSFIEFGGVVDKDTNPKALPTFEYRVKKNAKVFSPVTGILSDVIYQETTNDYELWFQFGKYLVSLDHVRNLLVKKGDRIEAGQVLGIVGPWDSKSGRTELMISSRETAYCPFTFFNKTTRTKYEQEVSDLMGRVEISHGNQYDEEIQKLPGCVVLEMSAGG